MDNKDLLRQYVDTGVAITEYQFNKLKGSFRQTYIRKRIQGVFAMDYGSFSSYEYRILDNETKKKYIKKLLRRHDDLPEVMFMYSDEDVRDYYIDLVIEMNESLHTYEYKALNDEQKIRYMMSRVNQVKRLTDDQLAVSSDDIKAKYMNARIELGRTISSWEFDEDMNDELRLKYITNKIKDTRKLENWEYEYAPDNLKLAYIKSREDIFLGPTQLDVTPDAIAMVYLNQRIEEGGLNTHEKNRYEKIKNGQ